MKLPLQPEGYLPSSVTCVLSPMVRSPFAHRAASAIEVDWTEAPLIVKLSPANKPGRKLFATTLEFVMRRSPPPLCLRGG